MYGCMDHVGSAGNHFIPAVHLQGLRSGGITGPGVSHMGRIGVPCERVVTNKVEYSRVIPRPLHALRTTKRRTQLLYLQFIYPTLIYKYISYREAISRHFGHAGPVLMKINTSDSHRYRLHCIHSHKRQDPSR